MPARLESPVFPPAVSRLNSLQTTRAPPSASTHETVSNTSVWGITAAVTGRLHPARIQPSALAHETASNTLE